MISIEDLSFLDEAKANFEMYPYQETYRNESESYIALRTGMDRDCIEIYRLGHRVANFTQQLDPLPSKLEKNKLTIAWEEKSNE